MKTVLIFSSYIFVTLSLFVPFAISVQFPISPPVIDIEGKTLKLGLPYHVFSNAFFYPDGVCLVDVNNLNTHCPHDVVPCTAFDKPIIGLPVIFLPVFPSEDVYVRENTPYKIQFSFMGNCNKENVWSLVDAHLLTPFWNPLWKFVTTDPLTLPTAAVKFHLQKTVFGYKIVSCVSSPIPIPFTPICAGIGFIPDGIRNRLGIGLGVLEVPFFFASNNATAVEKLQAATSQKAIV